jgi:hypothetical protein
LAPSLFSSYIAKSLQKKGVDQSEESKAFDEKLRREKQKKELKVIFQGCYPELVDGNGNIKYPINDNLLRKMPELHDIHELPERPKLFKVFLEDSGEFEDLMQIWEFASNCLLLPKPFKVEELYAGLKFTEDTEEVTLVSDIVCEILEMAVKEIPDEQKEEDESLLWMIKQISDDKLKFIWPCLIGIFIEGELFEYTASSEVKEIGTILQGATPKTFNSLLTYDQKIKILLFLCNS